MPAHAHTTHTRKIKIFKGILGVADLHYVIMLWERGALLGVCYLALSRGLEQVQRRVANIKCTIEQVNEVR